MLLSTALFCSAVLLPFPQEPAKLSVDRSGEAQLRRLITHLSKAKLRRFTADVLSRESAGGVFLPGYHFEIAFGGPNVARLNATDIWGTNYTVISDGKSWLRDDGDMESQPVLGNVGKGLLESESNIAIQGTYALVLTYLHQGETGLKQLAPEETPVGYRDEAGLSRISIPKSPFGDLSIFFRWNRNQAELIRAEYDNFAQKQKLFAQFPDWYAEPEAGSMDLELWGHGTWRFGGKKPFDTTPQKGISIRDERKAKP